MNVVVIGPGLMGSQIGCEYALGGHTVIFVARRPDKAYERVERALQLAEEFGLMGRRTDDQARQRIEYVRSMDVVRVSVDLVVESIVESFEEKATILRAAASRWPAATLASNTSSLSISALGEAAGAAERTIGTHYWNPPLLMPLVEVVRGERTRDEAVALVTSALQALGKRPVQIERDVPGFVWNRLQLALLREAVWIVENGVATPDVVDEIVRDGLARRWRLTGPFETVALGGPDMFTRIAANLFPVLSDEHELRDIGRWLRKTPRELEELRSRRDAGLLQELQRDDQRSPQREAVDG